MWLINRHIVAVRADFNLATIKNSDLFGQSPEDFLQKTVK